MAAGITYYELLKQARALAKNIRSETETHKQLAKALGDEAKDTGLVAEQIATLNVDSSTVSETREVSRIMQGLSTTALAYANTADEASRAATAAEQEAIRLHDGIQQAADATFVAMAKSVWYTQE